MGNRTKTNRGAVEAAGSAGSRERDNSWRECPREGEMGALRRKRPRRRQKRGKRESAEREEVREQGSTAPRGQRRRCRRKTAPGEQRGGSQRLYPRREPTGQLRPALPLLTWEPETKGGLPPGAGSASSPAC